MCDFYIFVFLFIGALLSTSQASLPFNPTLLENTPPKCDTNSVRSSPEMSLVSLHVTPLSSPVTSYPSPSTSPSGSPVTSPTGLPSFQQQSCSGNINWTFRPHGRAMTVYEWLRRLRLHKYSDVFRGKTFDEVRSKTQLQNFLTLSVSAGSLVNYFCNGMLY